MIVGLSLTASLAFAGPRTPTNDAEVLEKLPLRANDPASRELRQLRERLRREPKDLDAALALANRYYDMVAQEGDPRYLGYAQAALAPWWDLEEPGDEVRVMRASLRQFGHGFDSAIADLDAVLRRSPSHFRARALRATLHIVQARYALARDDCSAMRPAGHKLVADACEAMVDGLTGKGKSALLALERSLRDTPAASPGEKLWTLLRLAEISQRLGDVPGAEKHFRSALQLGIADTFLYAAWADLLLDAGRWQEVVDLTRDKTASDGLLLRLVLAERALNLPQAKQRVDTLAARYAAARLRGDTVHEQEEARFLLALGRDPEQALALASNNWTLQREPRDARVLLEAAIAARKPGPAAPVVEWFDSNRVEDVRLAALVRQWRELPR